jgi:hypothetical protein
MGTFNEYGCACRCLLKLLADRGTPMTVDGFLTRFPYPHWQASHPDPKPGVTSTAVICDVARQLCLASDLQVLRGYPAVQGYFASGKSVLVCSEVHLDPKCSETVYHVSLLTAIDPEQFSLWCPVQDGSDVPLKLAAAEWDTKLCHGIALFPCHA